MGCLVWPSSPANEDNTGSKTPTTTTTVPRPITKSPEEGKIVKPVKTQKKPPRFLKMDHADSNKNGDKKHKVKMGGGEGNVFN